MEFDTFGLLLYNIGNPQLTFRVSSSTSFSERNGLKNKNKLRLRLLARVRGGGVGGGFRGPACY